MKIAWLQGSFNVLPMYMGVILQITTLTTPRSCAPHVYGGDPEAPSAGPLVGVVLPMYMGVIPYVHDGKRMASSAPHVYGGDPKEIVVALAKKACSPCIWG